MEKVAIIIINYKDYAKKYLADYYHSLKQETYPYQLIIVDNQSSEASRAFLKSIVPEADIVAAADNSGYVGGMNLGTRRAADLGFEYVLFANFDAEIGTPYIAELVRVLKSDPQIGAVQSRIMLWPEKDKVNSLGNSIHFLGFGFSAGGYQNLNLNDLKTVEEITYPSGVSILMRLDLFLRLGGFEKSFFMYHEDLDLGWKIRLAGYRVVLARDSVIYHKYKFAQSIKQYFWMERNRFFTVLKNYKIATILIFLPAAVVMEIGLLFFALIKGYFFQKLRVYLELLRYSFWRDVLAGRKLIKKIRQVKDREILKLFVGKIKNQEVDNWLLNKVANPVFYIYFKLLRAIIFW